MKVGKIGKLCMGVGAIVALVTSSASLAIAQTTDPVDPNEILMTTSVETVSSTREQRLMQRKEALTARLTTAQANRLRTRCKAAQTKLQAVGERAQTAITKRQTAFQSIQTKLQSVVDKLPENVDDAELTAAVTVLEEKIAAFETATTTYTQTLADTAELDCMADAEAFKASLEAAKTERTTVATAAQAVRTHVQDTIKPLLQTIRNSLESQEAN